MLEQLTAILKGLTYFAALSGAGMVLVQATLFRGHPSDAGRTLLIRIAGAVLASVACAATMVFAVRLDDASTTDAIEAVLFSPLGAALGFQIMGGIWIALFASRPIAFAGALLILCSFGVVGHSATRGFISAATVLVHVTTAAWWLGGLWALLIASSKHCRDFYAALVKTFSGQAIWIVALLLVAAVATAAPLLGFQIDWTRDYDFGLVVKAGLTIGLLALAATNRYALSARLRTSPFAFKLLRCAIAMEIALFIAIITATASLTTWHSPHERDQEEAQISGPITIIDPWAPASVGTLPTGAGYLMIVNNSQTDDRLLSASSPWAEYVTLHASTSIGRVARMDELNTPAIPAQGQLKFAPGGNHLMLTGLYTPLVAGDEVPVQLRLERAGDVTFRLKVLPLGERPATSHDH